MLATPLSSPMPSNIGPCHPLLTTRFRLSYPQPFEIHHFSSERQSYNSLFTANFLRYGNSGWRAHSRASLKHGLIMFKVTYETCMAGAHCGLLFSCVGVLPFGRRRRSQDGASSYGLRSYRCEPDQHNCCEGTCSFSLAPLCCRRSAY